jgi:hypothetical protein
LLYFCKNKDKVPPLLERNEKKKFLGLNRPFFEVANFENTMAIDLEILSDSKIKI